MHPLPDRSTDLRTPLGDTTPGRPPTGPDAQMTVEVTPGGSVVVSGEIDHVTAPDLYQDLEAALRAHPEGVTLDLAAVTFCDCVGLRAFVAARHGHLKGGRCPLALGPVSPRMSRLLQLTGTGALFAPPIAPRQAGQGRRRGAGRRGAGQ
ncbi:STAS domain-containing protein [Streptomyces sp. NBC_00572]|uniref:STAS domain-containing protein n=1 Tax=Streptomyces sp. NBC_00572 TaxID=2903664 RepID=UPI0022520913|nr:STAS domain-containing protein [Streptomyces sp. NBC_00572]MCX4986421.1 STAS domain-containing protein [Streptomyces sp. NBC_00572]